MDTRSFEKTAKRIRPLMVRTARQMLCDNDEAEDVVQDCMLKLWTIREDLPKYSSIEGLAVTIVRRLSINSLRRNKPDEHLDLQEATATIPSPEEDYERHEQAEYLDNILSSLPDSQQTLIRLRHIEGFDNAAIASLIGSSEGAVRTALCRARRQIADIFLSSQQH